MKSTTAQILSFLACFALLPLCAQAQVQPQGKPTPAPSPVTVVNTDAAPVPVKVLSSADTGGVLVEMSPTGGYVDTRQYRRFAILGMPAAGGTGNVVLAFVDDPDAPTARIYVGSCVTAPTSLGGGLVCTAWPPGSAPLNGYNVSGPFLEVYAPSLYLTTLKVYLQK